jgi:hypothetical protein
MPTEGSSHTSTTSTQTVNLTITLTLTLTLTLALALALTFTLSKNKRKQKRGGLKCVSLDDSLTLLKAYERMLHNKYLKAEESIVIGKNHAEIEAAVDIIMGRKTNAWLSLSQWPADIVTLDQQLGHDHLQGTDIAAALAEENFEGVVCILSGGSEEDMEQYMGMPGVDMVVSKATSYQQVAKALLEKHVAKKIRNY